VTNFYQFKRASISTKDIFKNKLKSNFIKFEKHISSNFYNRLQEVAIILKNLNNFSTPQLVYNQMWLNFFMDDYY